MDDCELNGIKSAQNGNYNCSLPTQSDAAEEKLNKMCEQRFETGCKLAKIWELCQQGFSDLLANRTSNCKPPDVTHFGHGHYEFCCKVCAKGIEAYKRRDLCDLKTRKRGELAERIKQLFAYCCTSVAFPALKSNEPEPDDQDSSSQQTEYLLKKNEPENETENETENESENEPENEPEDEPKKEPDDSSEDIFREARCANLECEQGCEEADQPYSWVNNKLCGVCGRNQGCVHFKGIFICKDLDSGRTTGKRESARSPPSENAGLPLSFNLGMLFLVGLATALTQMKFV